MKFKKIIPIVTAASSAAVVLPLVTSCANYTFSYSFNKKDDKWTEWAPKTKPLAKDTKIQEGKELEYYLKAIYKDTKIFADDIAFIQYNVYTKPAFNDQLDVSVKLITTPDIKNNTVSFELTVQWHETDEDVTRTIKVLYENLDLVVYKDGDTWNIRPAIMQIPFTVSEYDKLIAGLTKNKTNITYSNKMVYDSTQETQTNEFKISYNDKIKSDDDVAKGMWVANLHQATEIIDGPLWYFSKLK